MNEWSKIMQLFADNLVSTNGQTGLQIQVNYTLDDVEPLLRCGMQNYGAIVLTGLKDGVGLNVSADIDPCFLSFRGQIITSTNEPIKIC